MSSSDLAIVERAQQGEHGAFDYLVLRHQHGLLRLIRRYVHGQAEAESIAQEAFLQAYRTLPSFRNDGTFYAWLCRIAIRIAKNAPASRRDSSELQKPERLVLTDEIRNTVHAAIERLPRELRMSILLREVEGMSYEQIAATMSCPARTVRSYIFLARAAIDARLRPMPEEELAGAEN